MRNEIDIFGFNDPKAYLEEEFGARKRSGRGWGLKKLALRAGFKSPSTISMILNGQRRLSPEAARKLARGLDLPAKKREYFVSLARLRHAQSEAERAEAMETIVRLKGTQRSSLDQSKFRFFSEWYYPVIYTLLGISGINSSAESLARRFGNRISSKKIERAIEDMLELGLLKREGENIVQSGGTLQTSEDVRDAAVHRYHQNMIGKAQEALELPVGEREMGAVSVTVNRADLPAIKKEIRRFRDELFERLNQIKSKKEDVYQLNIQFFPLTEKQGLLGFKKESN